MAIDERKWVLDHPISGPRVCTAPDDGVYGIPYGESVEVVPASRIADAERIRAEDVPTVIEALRSAASDCRAYVETLGKHDPEPVRQRSLERAGEYDRIAAELGSS